MGKAFKRLFDFLSSYGLAVTLLLLLFVLTFLGTLEQTDKGLYEVQRKYFSSWFLVHRLFGAAPIPLPGARLLLGLLAVNLACGGICRARKGCRQAGVLMAHLGILILLAGGLVASKLSVNGYMTLHEHEMTDCFESERAWEIVLSRRAAAGRTTEYIIPAADLDSVTWGDDLTFYSPAVPFELIVENYLPNCRPVRTGEDISTERTVDEFALEPLPLEADAQGRVPGAYIRVARLSSNTSDRELLWGASQLPLTLDVDGDRWSIDLRRRTWQLPFTVTLNKFVRELHPGTEAPKRFASVITLTEWDARPQFEISMNRPLRYRGYTFFQASWGPPDAAPGEPLYSVLAVVRNPAEMLPMYASCVIGLGLCLHFGIRLGAYLRRVKT